MKKTILLFSIFLLFALQGWGVTCTSTGTSQKDWNSNSAWTGAGCTTTKGPPTGATVIIAKGTSILVDSSNTQIPAGITINSGGTLAVQSDKTLSFSGNLTNNGTFTAQSKSTVKLTGTGQTLSGNLSFYNLILGTDTILTGNIIVKNRLTGTPKSTCPTNYTIKNSSGTLLGESCPSASGGGCSVSAGKMAINEVYVGSSSNTSTRNKIELYNIGNISPTIWRNWRITITRISNGSLRTYNYPLTNFVDASGFITNSNVAIYLRSTSSSYDIALWDAPTGGNLIDYVALNGYINSNLNGCTPTTPPAYKLTNTNSKNLNLYRWSPDGSGSWNFANAAGTVGRTNGCTSGSNLIVEQTLDITQPMTLDTITYTVTATNPGCLSLTNVNITDTLTSSTNLTNFSYTCSSGTCSSATGLWTLPAIPAQQVATMTIKGTVPSSATNGTVYTNTAVGSIINDINTLNNTATNSATVVPDIFANIDLVLTDLNPFETDGTSDLVVSLSQCPRADVTIPYTIVNNPSATVIPHTLASGNFVIKSQANGCDPTNPSATLTYSITPIYKTTSDQNITVTLGTPTPTNSKVVLGTDKTATITIHDDPNYKILVDDDKGECPNAQFTTITSALAAATAGDTIEICKGTYSEAVTVKTNDLTIVGQSGNRDDVIVTTSSGTVFSSGTSNLANNNLVIKDITIKQTSTSGNAKAIDLVNGTNITLDNIFIQNSGGYAVYGESNFGGTGTYTNMLINSAGGGFYIPVGTLQTFDTVSMTLTGTSASEYGIFLGSNITRVAHIFKTLSIATKAAPAIYVTVAKDMDFTDIDIIAIGYGDNSQAIYTASNVDPTANISFKNIAIDINKGKGIEVTTANNTTFDTVSIKGSTNYALIENSNVSGIPTLKNVTIQANSNSGIDIKTGHDVVMDGVTISGVTTNNAIYLESNVNGSHTFKNINISSTDATGILVNVATNVSLENSSITVQSGANARGFETAANVSGIITIKNSKIETFSDALKVATGTDINISGSTFITNNGRAVTFESGNVQKVNAQSSCFTENSTSGNSFAFYLYNNRSSSTVNNNCFYGSPSTQLAAAQLTGNNFTGNFWNGVTGSYNKNNIIDNSPLAICPATSCYSVVVPPPPPIAEYRMDECSWNGTIGEVQDSSGNDIVGTAQNGATTDAGQLNNSGHFIAANSQYVSIPTNNSLKITNVITFSSWIKRDSIDNRLQNIYNHGQWNNALRLQTDNKALFSLQLGSTPRTLYSIQTISDTNWHHIAGTYDGSKMSVYIDGALDNSAPYSGAIGTSNSFYSIGSENGNGYFFNGSIDEVKVFSDALTAPQIALIYSNENGKNNYDGIPRDPIGCLIADYRMDECSWSTAAGQVKDYSTDGIDNSGDINGSVSTTTSGKINGGGSFTGGSININNLKVSTVSDAKTTVAFWMNWNGDHSNPIAPFAWERLGLAFVNTNFGFSTFANNDILGIDGTSLAGSWHHVVAVFNYGDYTKNKLYIDGQIMTLTATGGAINSTRDYVSSMAIIGSSFANSPFKSPIDELKIWNGELSAADVSTVYNNEFYANNYDGNPRTTVSCTSPECTNFSYQPYHRIDSMLTPQYRLHTRLANAPFDINVTVACSDPTKSIPARKIKNIYAISGVCPATTAGLTPIWNKVSTDINDTIRTITINDLNITKAYSNIKLMLETNATTLELNCSDDNFSIRPSYFSGNISDFKAGEQNSSSITTIDANDTINTNTLDYNTTVSTYRDISIASGCESNTTAKLIDNMSITFQNGKSALVNAKFKDVGDFNTTLFDSSWNDGDCISGSGSNTLINGLYGCNVEGNISIKVSPYELNTTLTNFLPTSSWLYLDSSRTQNVEINTTVSAYGKDGTKTKNFSDGCSVFTIPIGFYFTPTGTVPTTDLDISLTHTSLDYTYNTVFNQPSFNVPSTSFKSGDANLSLKFNFIRPTIPISPFNLKLTDIKTSSGFNDNNATITDKNTTFVYGRIHASDIQTDQNTSVPNPVEIEVYSNDSTNPFIIGKSQNVLKWYRNTDHDNNLSGSVLSGQSTKDTKITIDNTSTNPLNNGIQTIYITNTDSNTTKQTINLTIPSWLSTTTANNTFQYQYVIPSTTIDTLTTTSTGVNSGTFTGSDFGIKASSNTTKKGIKVFR
ncbi:MAG: LamG-like jellyroll fold domain-containing protein [Sulfurimonas sp.]|jgi:hypothetical protein